MKKRIGLVMALIISVVTLNFGQVELKEISSIGQKKFKKAAKRVYIANFRVNYQLLYSQSETAEGGRELGGGQRGDVSAGLTMGVKGVEEADLSEITNELYQTYVANYKKAGYEIINVDEAAKTKELEEFQKVEGGTLSEDQVIGYISSTPSDYQYLIKKTTSSGKEKGRYNGYKLSADLKGALVVDVNLMVPFVIDAESSGSKNLTKAVGGVAKIVLKPYLRIDSEKTEVEHYFAEKRVKPESYSNMKLKKDLEVSGVFEDKKYKVSDAADTDNWGTDYGTMKLFNVSDKYITKTIPVECEGEKYKLGVKKAGQEYLDATFNLLKEYSADK